MPGPLDVIPFLSLDVTIFVVVHPNDVSLWCRHAGRSKFLGGPPRYPQFRRSCDAFNEPILDWIFSWETDIQVFDYEWSLENLIMKIFDKNIGILLPKLFWPTVGKKCSSDREKLLKFETEGREFAKLLRIRIQIVKK